MGKSRREKMTEFNQSIYLAASFFKMKTTGSPVVDTNVNKAVGHLRLFPHPLVESQVILERDPWTKRKQKNVLRGEDVHAYNTKQVQSNNCTSEEKAQTA